MKVAASPTTTLAVPALRQKLADYVELTNGAYRVAGSRVSLDSIVYAFKMAIRQRPLRSPFRC